MDRLKFLSILILLFVVGCSKNEYINCYIDVENNIQNYTLKANYKVYYKDSFVTNIEKEEQYISDDKDILDYFYESKQLEYYNLSDKYGGVTYDIKNLNDSIKLTININLKEVDLSSMVKDDRIKKDYVKSDKLLLSGIKKIYSSKGAICE